ncbi:MAG: putative addiction module antidote protein [Herbaspirillum sp.]|nr:putative addiction module antidote protein [Herbaspirillum sp.]
MTIKITPFDASKYLDSEEAISEYINAAIEEDDVDLFIAALANVVKAYGIAKVASDAGIGRESLYKTLAPGSSPRFETVMKLVKALGITITTVPMHSKVVSHS